MPVSTEFRENGYVLHAAFSDPWDLTDLQLVFVQAHKAHRRIHVLLNMSETSWIPPGLVEIIRNELAQPAIGALVLVGASLMMRALLQFAFRLTPFDRSKFMDTEAEAWLYLREVVAREA